MILIEPKINEREQIDGPVRMLTVEESSTVTSQGFNGTHYVYYQGDEPAFEPSLEQLKQVRMEAVDQATEAAISNGFVFDGVLFSMSANAQLNWSNIPTIPDNLFPLPIMGKNEDLYNLALANKMNFYLTALGFKNAQLQNGTVKKMAIKSCQTIAELNNIP